MKKLNLAKRLMGFTLILVILAAALSFQISASDYEDNWAKGVIDSFIAQKIIALDADGNVRPSEEITRAETIAVINKAFNFTQTAAINYTDVSGADSFYADIQIAEAMGYMPNGSNVSEFRPYDALTREEMMIVIARVLELQPKTTLVDIKYNDGAEMSAEGKGALGALLEPSVNIAESLGDDSFYPNNGLKRNLAFALVNKAMDYYQNLQSGRKLYSSINVDTAVGSDSAVTKNFNNVTIVGKNAVLENVVVWGNLTIDKSVGSDSVTIKNVTVKGNLFIYGGSTVNLINVNNIVKSLTVNKANNNLALNISGSSAITEIIVKSGVTIDASSLTPSKITLTSDISKGVKVTVGVNTVKELIVQSAGVNLTINAMTVGELNIARGATGAFVDVTKGSTVSKAIVNAVCDIQGAGTLLSKQVNVNGANVAVTPGRTTTSTSTSARPTSTAPSSTYSSITYAPSGTYERYYNYQYNGYYYNTSYPYYAYPDYYTWCFGQYGYYPTYDQYNTYIATYYPNGFNGYWGGHLVYPYTSHDEYVIWYRSYYGTSSIPTLNDYYNAVYGIYGYYPYNYPNYPNYPTTSTGVTLDQTTATVSVGGSIQLVASIWPANSGDYIASWYSSNTSVAYVSTTGLVTGISGGPATITVTTALGRTATCSVTVPTSLSPSYPSSYVSLSQSTAAINTTGVNKTVLLTASIHNNYTSDYIISWHSSNDSIATVANGLVTGINAGNATITVRTRDGHTATCTVTVTEVNVPVTGVAFTAPVIAIKKTQTFDLKTILTISPTTATNKTVNWTSDVPTIISVNSAGVVTALGDSPDSAIITVTTADGSFTDTITVGIIP